MGAASAARDVRLETEVQKQSGAGAFLHESVKFVAKPSLQQELMKDFAAAKGNEYLTTAFLQKADEKLLTVDEWQSFARDVNNKNVSGQQLKLTKIENGGLTLEIGSGDQSSTYKITLGSHLDPVTGKVTGASVELKKPGRNVADEFETGGNELINILPSDKPIDPLKPTVIIVDTFDTPEIDLDRHGHGPSHGEISARPTDAMDRYNVIRVQVRTAQLPSTKWHLADSHERDYSGVFEAINQKIESGELLLGKGDVINISFGNNALRRLGADKTPILIEGKPVLIEGTGEPNFAEINELLAGEFITNPVTPENLREMRPKILDRLKEIAGSADLNDQIIRGSWLRAVLATNVAIEKVQQKGIQVMVAAGNDGPDRVSWDYLSAEKQLAAVDQSGEYLPWSAHNSLTEPYLGRFDLKYDKGVPGIYRLDGTDAKFAAKEFGITEIPDRCLQRRKNDPYVMDALPFSIVGNSKSGCVVGAADGTSYANVFALIAEYEERRKIKVASQPH